MYNRDMVVELLAEVLGENCKVTYTTVTKTNGLELEGVSIVEGDNPYGPVIYFDERMDDWSEDEVASYVYNTYKTLDKEPPIQEDVSSKEYVMANVYLTLVNRESNLNLLETSPYKELEDLVFIPRVRVKCGNGNGSYVLTHRHLEALGISVDDVMTKALENTKEKVEVQNMFDMFCDELDLPPNVPMMLTMSNDIAYYGAGCICNTEMLMHLAEKAESDLFILPSSVHEVILVRAEELIHFKRMVKEVNDNHVEPNEILSYNVYKFSRETGEISLA